MFADRLVTVDRWRRGAPLSVLGLPRHLWGAALDNARRSLIEISAAVTDRTRQLEDLKSGSQSGDLLRLSPQACLDLLGSRTTGRLAYVARAGVPDIAPVNYVMAGSDLLIRSAPGPKLQAAERRERVAFEVDDIDEQTQHGWSVVVAGVAEPLTPEQAAQLPQPVPWANGSRRHTLRIRPTRIDGRKLL